MHAPLQSFHEIADQTPLRSPNGHAGFSPESRCSRWCSISWPRSFSSCHPRWNVQPNSCGQRPGACDYHLPLCLVQRQISVPFVPAWPNPACACANPRSKAPAYRVPIQLRHRHWLSHSADFKITDGNLMQGLGIAVFPQRTEELLVVFSAIPLLPFKIRGALWEHRLTNPAMRQIAVQIGPCIQTLVLCNQKGGVNAKPRRNMLGHSTSLCPIREPNFCNIGPQTSAAILFTCLAALANQRPHSPLYLSKKGACLPMALHAHVTKRASNCWPRFQAHS